MRIASLEHHLFVTNTTLETTAVDTKREYIGRYLLSNIQHRRYPQHNIRNKL